MKKLLASLLVMILALSAAAMADDAYFCLPEGFEFGMTYEQTSIATAHYGGGSRALVIPGVIPDDPSVTAEMNFCVLPLGSETQMMGAQPGTLFETLTRVEILFCVDGSPSPKNDRSAEYAYVEQALTAKYGETAFKGSGSYGSHIMLNTATALEGAIEMSQRIVPYANGGYVVITHAHYPYGRDMYRHAIEVYFVGYGFEMHDNMMHEVSLSLDDVI